MVCRLFRCLGQKVSLSHNNLRQTKIQKILFQTFFFWNVQVRQRPPSPVGPSLIRSSLTYFSSVCATHLFLAACGQSAIYSGQSINFFSRWPQVIAFHLLSISRENSIKFKFRSLTDLFMAKTATSACLLGEIPSAHATHLHRIQCGSRWALDPPDSIRRIAPRFN